MSPSKSLVPPGPTTENGSTVIGPLSKVTLHSDDETMEARKGPCELILTGHNKVKPGEKWLRTSRPENKRQLQIIRTQCGGQKSHQNEESNCPPLPQSSIPIEVGARIAKWQASVGSIQRDLPKIWPVSRTETEPPFLAMIVYYGRAQQDQQYENGTTFTTHVQHWPLTTKVSFYTSNAVKRTYTQDLALTDTPL